MTEYVETFIINRKTYGIEAGADGQFTCWVGGCRIGSRPTLPAARATLHSYAVSQARAEAGSAGDALERASDVLERLGADPFNLGRFRTS